MGQRFLIISNSTGKHANDDTAFSNNFKQHRKTPGTLKPFSS